MANVSAPRGLIPVRHKNGAPYNGAATLYFVPATDGTALFIGDPVIVAGSADARGTPTVTKATAAGGNYITGAVVATFSADTVANKPTKLFSDTVHRAASTAAYVLVADDPDLIFEIQEDSVTSTLAATNVSQNADWVNGTGSTTTGYSGVMLDSNTADTTNTLQLRIIGLADRESNEIGTYAKWLVSINLHSQRSLTGV